jgi:hypothetical protein
MRILLSWSSLICLTNFFAIYKTKIQSIAEIVIEHIDRENREYLATIPISDHWLDQNLEAKSLGVYRIGLHTLSYRPSSLQHRYQADQGVELESVALKVTIV